MSVVRLEKSRLFLPTPSARRATQTASLHPQRRMNHFYPRPPRGGRPFHDHDTITINLFLPTPSARRATFPASDFSDACAISTHALREEGDQVCARYSAFLSQFLPTPSARRATGRAVCAGLIDLISTHALREEGDPSACGTALRPLPFLPTPSARRATLSP